MDRDLKDWEASTGMETPQEPSLSLLSLAADQLKYRHDGKYGRRNCNYHIHTFSFLESTRC
jgi:hypothetical protein